MTTISMAAIRQRHEVRHGKFFTPGNMRFFSSRLPSRGFLNLQETKAFFVTSERSGYDRPRLFSVRCMNMDTGHIDTVGDFHSFTTGVEANRVARRLAQETP